MKEEMTNGRTVRITNAPATRPENANTAAAKSELVADLSAASLLAFAISILLLALAVTTAGASTRERKAAADAGRGSARDDARGEHAA